MDKEAKESQLQLAQIRIAQIQSNINMFISMSAGFFAIMAGSIVAGYQFIIDGLITDGIGVTLDNLPIIVIILVMFYIAIRAGLRAYQNLDKVKLSRRELCNLKKLDLS